MIDFEMSGHTGSEVIYVNAHHVRSVRQAPKEGKTPDSILGMTDGSEIWVKGIASAVVSALEAELARNGRPDKA